jgi:SPP1 gp7 family putative phage head morphogenesis protein
MGSIYDETQLENLENEEHELTLVAILALLTWLNSTKNNLEQELRRFYQKYGKDGVVTYSEFRKWVSDNNHQRRSTWLTLFIGSLFSNLFNSMKPEFETMIISVIQKEFNFFGVAIDTPKLNWGMDNLTWVDRLADNVTTWNAYVTTDVKRAVLARKNIEEVAELLNKRFLTMENVIKRLAITETTAVGSIARKAAFKELGITKYKYFAREDERTCEQCGALHGLIFPISAYEPGVTASPIHSNCRCHCVPIRE